MKKVFFLLMTVSSFAAAQNPFEANYLSRQRLQMKDVEGYFFLAEQAYTLAPQNLEFAMNFARACALIGRQTQCFSVLDNIAAIGFDFEIEKDTAFAKYWRVARFQQIAARAKLNTKKTASDYAFSIGEKDLIPEGITYDPRQQKFYVSSIYKRKIVSINPDGVPSDFMGEAQNGLYSTVGMKVDAARNHLWVIGIINKPYPHAYNKEDLGKAAVYQFNLETKELIHKYVLKDTLRHMFNDLVIVNGSVYITDSGQRSVYKINTATKEFELFFRAPGLFFPNGITASSDQKYLFVASWVGINRITIADSQTVMVEPKVTTTLSGIDGLYFYENSLIAIQNSAGPQSRIMKFDLNKQMDAVVKSTLLESDNPLYNRPTTGTIVGDEFYFIANSQMTSFDAEGKIFPIDQLQPTYILKLKLKN